MKEKSQIEKKAEEKQITLLSTALSEAYPSMGEKMQAVLLNTYLERGIFPEWASPGHRGCMVGNNSASVVADAFMKNCLLYTSRNILLPPI